MADSVGTFSVVGLFDDSDIRRKLQGLSGEATQTGTKIGQGLSQGFDKGSQSAAQAGASAERAAGSYTKAGREMQTAANGLKFYTDATGRARQSNVQLAASLQTAEAGLKGVAASSGLAAGSIKGLISSLAGIVAGVSVVGFLKASFQSAAELETITRKLTNTLGPGGASGALSFIRELSDRTGQSFKALAGGFSSFTAAATAANIPLGTQRDLFAAVARAGQSLGLSNEEISGSLLALQQIASKGTVSMEELRQQLGERLPIALSAAARGLGITVQELNKLVEGGGLSAQEFFPALTRGLNQITETSQGAVTAAQNIGQLENAWDRLKTAVGEEFLPIAVEAVRGLTSVLEQLGTAISSGSDVANAGRELKEVQQIVQNIKADIEAKKELNVDVSAALASLERVERRAAELQSRLANLNRAEQIKQQVLQLEEQKRAYERQGVSVDALVEKQKALAKELFALTGSTEPVRIGQLFNGLFTDAITLTPIATEEIKKYREQIQQLEKDLAGLRVDFSVGQSKGENTSGIEKQIDQKEKALIKAQQDLQIELGNTDAIRQRALETQRQEQINTDKLKRAEQERGKAAQVAAKTAEDAAKAQSAAFERQIALIGQIADAEERRGRAGVADLQARLQVIDALVARENAYRSLQEALFDVELSRARARGASPGEIEGIEQRALVAQVEAAQRRFEVERVTLALKQQQAAIEQQLAVNAAQRAVAEAAVQFAQAVNNGESADMLATRREIYGLLEQQLRLEQQRTQTLPALQQIERETLGIQEQTVAAQLRATAAAKGWEDDLAAPLSTLQRSADAFKALENTDLRGTVYPATTAAMGLATAMWDAQRASAQFVQDLRAAAGIEPARWAGGPVIPGQGYRINELGQESFLSRTGDLSLITAPTNARWIPPTEGTVIPAAFTRVLRERGMFDRISRTASPSTVVAPQRVRRGRDQGAVTARLAAQVAVLSQEVRALHRKDWNVRVGVRQREGAISFANRLAALR